MKLESLKVTVQLDKVENSRRSHCEDTLRLRKRKRPGELQPQDTMALLLLKLAVENSSS